MYSLHVSISPLLHPWMYTYMYVSTISESKRTLTDVKKVRPCRSLTRKERMATADRTLRADRAESHTGRADELQSVSNGLGTLGHETFVPRVQHD